MSLDTVANAKASQRSKNCKKYSQPCPVFTQSIFNHIHRATNMVAKWINFSVVNGK